MKNKKTGKNKALGNQENPENLENLETKNYNPPGKKLEFSRVGGRGAWLPLWLLKKKGVPVLKLLWQRSWRLLSPSLVSLRAVSSWVLHVLTFASRFFVGQPPPPISLRAGLQHNFPTFRHMEIGDRRSETGTKILQCGDRRSEIGSEPLQGRDRRSEIGRAFKASGR